VSDLYTMISQCLDSEAYAGKQFHERAYQWLEESQDKTFQERFAGWVKLHEEYLALSEAHWRSLWKRIEDGRVGNLKQGELFA
jgi:hypothetical protein